MILPPNFFEQLRSVLRVSDIVRGRVVLSKRGAEYQGLCPFHNEKSPSFTVNDAKRFYHCFGCGAHGDVIKFTSEVTGLEYKQAAIKLAEDNGIDIPKPTKELELQYKESDHIQQILAEANRFFLSNLSDTLYEYLSNRGISKSIIKEFGIGFAPGRGSLSAYLEKKSIPMKDLFKAGLVRRSEDGRIYELFNNRLTIPIKNIYNKIVGFGGRVMDNSMPKYINSPETLIFKKSETMYGENMAASAARQKNFSILVEGYMDVLALNKAGHKEAVACLGTSATTQHLQKLWRFGDEIIVCLDGDKAGAKAASRVIDIALPFITPHKKLSFITLPEGMDPDDLINKNGESEFEKLLARRISLSEQLWVNVIKSISLKTAEDRSKLEGKLKEYTNQIKDPGLARNFDKFFREQTWNFISSRKKNKSKTAKVTSNIKASSLPNQTETQVLEYSIFNLIFSFPVVLTNPMVAEEFMSLGFNDTELTDLRDEVLQIIDGKDNIEAKFIADELKKTRFSQLYSLLCDSGQMCIEVDFIEQNIENLPQFFSLLKKKLFLLQLKNEYAKIATSNEKEIATKSIYYIDEIQKTTRDILELSNALLN